MGAQAPSPNEADGWQRPRRAGWRFRDVCALLVLTWPVGLVPFFVEGEAQVAFVKVLAVLILSTMPALLYLPLAAMRSRPARDDRTASPARWRGDQTIPPPPPESSIHYEAWLADIGDGMEERRRS